MTHLEQLIVHRTAPKVKGWRGAGGRGLCNKCCQMKEREDFPTATGRVCKDCTREVKRDRLGRFAADVLN